MNSGVIFKIEYLPNSGASYQELDVIPFTGTYSEPPATTRAGTHYTFNANFKIAKIKPEIETILDSIKGRQAIFRITDVNGRVYTVGDAVCKAMFEFGRRIDGTPGSFNGYDCKITRQSTSLCPMV